MANNRSARALARKLGQLDDRIHRELLKDRYNLARIDQIEAQKAALMKEAAKKGVTLVSVQVADGSALYYETRRNQSMVTFEWLYGGGDGYISDWGKTVVIPLATATKLIKHFDPTNI